MPQNKGEGPPILKFPDGANLVQVVISSGGEEPDWTIKMIFIEVYFEFVFSPHMENHSILQFQKDQVVVN